MLGFFVSKLEDDQIVKNAAKVLNLAALKSLEWLFYHIKNFGLSTKSLMSS